MAIDDTSPAYDAGDNATCESFDQRGVSRPRSVRCDIGAYEYIKPSADLSVSTTSIGTAIAGKDAQFLIQLDNNGPTAAQNVILTVTPPASTTFVSITGSGGFDYAKRRGELRLVLPKDAIGAEEHKPLIELLTPGALYMKDRGEGVPDGKWVRVDTTRLPDGNLVTGGATEPLAAAELLRGAQDVTLVGQETLDGTPVRHYRGTADIARAARAVDPAARGPLEAAARGFTVTGVPFDAWLDGQGRLRRLTQRFTFSSAGTGKGAGQDVTVVSTTTFDGFGVAVPVTMPRAADIWTGKIVSSRPR